MKDDDPPRMKVCPFCKTECMPGRELPHHLAEECPDAPRSDPREAGR